MPGVILRHGFTCSMKQLNVTADLPTLVVMMMIGMTNVFA